MSMFILKIIAVIAMLIDHSAMAFQDYFSVEMYQVMRSVGRCAFPIFVFCIAEGCHRTKDMGKYLLRLGVFAFMSELPFDMLFGASWGWSLPNFFTYYAGMLKNTIGFTPEASFYNLFTNFDGVFHDNQNVFFTLFLGALAIHLYKIWHEDGKYIKNIFVGFLAAFAMSVLANILNTDYGYLGVLTIFGCYICEKRHLRPVPLLIFAVLLYFPNLDLLFNSESLLYFILRLSRLVSACTAALLVYFYNEKRGPSLKWAFYAFYPVHLFILGASGMLLSGLF